MKTKSAQSSATIKPIKMANEIEKGFTRLSAAGFSLVETAIVVGLAGIISLGMVEATMNINKVQQDSTSRTELDRAHSLALQKTRNVLRVAAALHISDTDIAFNRCLNGHPRAGDDCASRAVSDAAPVSVDQERITSPAGNSRYDSNTLASLSCTAAGCDNVKLTTTTQLVRDIAQKSDAAGAVGHDGQKQMMTETTTRSTASTIPAKTFAPIKQIEWTCPAGQVLTTINLTTRQGICVPMIGSNQCDHSQPLSSFGVNRGCQVTTTAACNSGFSRLAMFDNKANCL